MNDTITIPAEHLETIAAALRHHLTDFEDAAGIGEQTAAGYILRALEWADRQKRGAAGDQAS